MINHKVIRLVVALSVGLFLAYSSYQWIEGQEAGDTRAREEAAVLAGRALLRGYVARDREIEIIDPLDPSRVIGKTYIYPHSMGWELSGFYRRNKLAGQVRDDRWHPYLMTLTPELELLTLSVQDKNTRLVELSVADTAFTVTP